MGELLEGKRVTVVGAGLAGCECALQLADRGAAVRLVEMRPDVPTAVHHGGGLAELVCSNSLKSTKPESAAGMLKAELRTLGSHLLAAAEECAVPAGGALAVDRERFSQRVTELVEAHPRITLERREATDILAEAQGCDALVLASGPLTSDALAVSLAELTGSDALAFYDAAAPIVLADSLDYGRVFRQSRYEGGEAEGEGPSAGDYLNAPFDKEEYERFMDELLGAERVVKRDFETRELFQACQPIEEIARSGRDAARFGPMKPVGLTDPATGRRPWAVVQLRAEDRAGLSFNLVGFQTNLTFPEQRRVFSMIPGFRNAEFVRFGVMHRNTFVDAPRLLDASLRLRAAGEGAPVHVVGQLSGTEGYCEAIRSGLHGALAVASELSGRALAPLPPETAFGSLLRYATDPATAGYQPMHVNFGIIEPLDPPVRNKGRRYEAYAARGAQALRDYAERLAETGLLARPVEAAGQGERPSVVSGADSAVPGGAQGA